LSRYGYFCYDVTLKSLENKKMKALPKSGEVLTSLGKGFERGLCSDLFVAGYSYKPQDLASDIEADYDDYRLLKIFKKATYISDRAKALLKERDIITLVKEGTVFADDGYIRSVADPPILPVREAVLPDPDAPFGIMICESSLFRFFLKTDKAVLPDGLEICGCPFLVESVEKITDSMPKKYVIQCNLQVCDDNTVSESSESRYRIAYDPVSKKKIILAGSIVSREDFFGETPDFIPTV